MVEQKTQEFTEQQVREKEEKRAMTKVESIRKNMCFFFPEFSLLEIDEQDKLIVSYLDQNDLNVIQFLISKGFKDNVKEDDKPKSL
jgi:ribosomal protein S12